MIEGLKFDLRVYVLMTCCDPLRLFLYPDGLVRLATELYEEPSKKNLKNLYMHLTNFSVNRNHKQFETDESAEAETGSKRSLVFVRKWLEAQGFAFTVVDITVQPPSRELLQSAVDQFGDRKPLFNTSGQSYRALGAAKVKSMSDEEALDALAAAW